LFHFNTLCLSRYENCSSSNLSPKLEEEIKEEVKEIAEELNLTIGITSEGEKLIV